ncbi:FliH/SctL family protein [Pseudoalteromonas shioyasakiensis]|uniref:FliH/SctL family protein n=1 Tax=Pseudoalteromonas shioyasakiensis TaxID=1190813 RepID=UPI00211911E8|nr:FliH/SctL family protein [Pseudoalteromonas shioyasakiensis]MCQ8877484.1 FliH/SctL family protein [Pseudoalteromonas shioyasakiensis]
MMTQPFRFPKLSKAEQQQTLQQRLEQAEQYGWQGGFKEGLKQGSINQKEAMEQEIEAQVANLMESKLAEHKTALIARFDELFNESQRQLDLHSDEINQAICQLVTKVTEKVLDCELQQQPQYLVKLVQQALTLLAGKDKVSEVIFSLADEECLAGANLEVLNVEVSFDQQLSKGDVQLIADQQTHSLSFSQRLDEILADSTATLLDN